MTSAPLPVLIVNAPSKSEALIVSAPVPPVTVVNPESAAFVPRVKLLVPSAVVSFSILSMFVKSASTIVAEFALNVMVSVPVPASIVSSSVRVVAVTVRLSLFAPESTERL